MMWSLVSPLNAGTSTNIVNNPLSAMYHHLSIAASCTVNIDVYGDINIEETTPTRD